MTPLPRLRSTLALAATLAAGAAITPAAQAQAMPVGIPTPTSNWPCEVLLCMANPRGPMAVGECVPPIRRLFRELARGRMFPVCTMASSPAGRSWAGISSSPYEPCPSGTRALNAGAYASLAAAMPPGGPPAMPSGSRTSYGVATAGVLYPGIGDGAEALRTAQANDLGSTFSTPMVCVGGPRGTTYQRVADGDDSRWLEVSLYETIYLAPPQLSGMAIDVFVDNQFWQRVRVDLTGY